MTAPIDHESVALWNPEWSVICPDFEGAPARVHEYQGRENVLLTHPISRTEPSALERTVALPKGSAAVLTFLVAADSRGDWELRTVVNGKILQKQLISHSDGWKRIAVDLSQYAGQTVKLRLENAANDWNYEFGYWSSIELKGLGTQRASAN